ncbi:hypothetical protein V1512DRAFT_229036 [Lipomyces arxii]|uniref:uncharacterized protein n=1 Tax=Lipomyces arxii TaxID=56418 RepID=UPI0034CE1866
MQFVPTETGPDNKESMAKMPGAESTDMDEKISWAKQATGKTTHAPIQSTTINLVENLQKPAEGEADVWFMRWNTLSSSLPLVAGSLGPVSNLFSIVAIVEPWGVTLDKFKHVTETFHEDGWIIALNAISLAFGVTANTFLLMNFAGRVRYNVSQAITISAFFIASFILTALLAVRSDQLEQISDSVFSQGYWSGAITAVLYFICAVVLTWNEIGHLMGLYPASFILSASQRSLMLQILCLTVWLAAGSGVFARVLQYSYADALYYCDVTILTIGLGDLHPWRDLGRALCLPYALVGVLITGLTVTSFRSLVILTTREKQTINRVDRLRIQHLQKLESVKIKRTGKESFQIMRDIHKRALKKDLRMMLLVCTFMFCIFWLIGALIFAKLESWTYFHGVYFSSLCLLTIGYGDFVPQAQATKPLFVIWSLIAIPLMTIFISSLGETIIAGVMSVTEKLGNITLKNVGTYAQPDFGGIVLRRLTNDLEGGGNRNGKTAEPRSSMSDLRSERNEIGYDDLIDDLDDDATKELDLIESIQQLLKDVRQNPHKKYSFDEWAKLSQALDKEFDWLGPNSPIRFPVDEPALFLRLYWTSLKEHLRQQRIASSRRTSMVVGKSQSNSLTDEEEEEDGSIEIDLSGDEIDSHSGRQHVTVEI